MNTGFQKCQRTMTYFSAAKDRAIIEAGGFFCESCLTGKPAGEQSPDPRYCHSCFKFLLNEAALLSLSRGKPGWGPVPGRAEALPAVKKVVAKLPDKGITPVGVLQHPAGRPRKEGKVHRTTEWRRKKEIQGLLV